ncbi:YadA C-terminal domain-containing protein [Salmonella enterica]|nr:YadA C-terminal domain-containing protein [Salmonella enterica]
MKTLNKSILAVVVASAFSFSATAAPVAPPTPTVNVPLAQGQSQWDQGQDTKIDGNTNNIVSHEAAIKSLQASDSAQDGLISTITQTAVATKRAADQAQVKVDNLKDDVSDNTDLINQEKSDRFTAVAALESRVNSAGADKDMRIKKNADGIAANGKLIAGKVDTSTYTADKATQATKDSDQDTRMDGVQSLTMRNAQRLNDHQTLIGDNAQGIKDANTRVDGVQSLTMRNAQRLNDHQTLIGDNAQGIKDANTRVDGVQSLTMRNAQRLNDHQTLINDNKTAIGTKVDKATAVTMVNNEVALTKGVLQNHADIGTETKRATDAEKANTKLIGDNKSAIDQNKTAIGDNTKLIDTETKRATTEEKRLDTVKAEKTEVAKNTTAIGTNSGLITKNAGDIQTNTQSIAKHETRITKNERTLSNHESRISTLEAQSGYGNKFNQLKSTVEQNRKHASAGIAGVAAMANIPQVSQGATLSFGAGVGNYDGEQGLAVGGSARIGKQVVTKFTVSATTQNDFVTGAGISYEW